MKDEERALLELMSWLVGEMFFLAGQSAYAALAAHLFTLKAAALDVDVAPRLRELGLDDVAADVNWHRLVESEGDRQLLLYFG